MWRRESTRTETSLQGPSQPIGYSGALCSQRERDGKHAVLTDRWLTAWVFTDGSSPARLWKFSDWEQCAGEPSQTPGRKCGPCFWTLRGRREKEASFTPWPVPSGPAGLLTRTELTPSIPSLVYRISKSSGKATSDCTRLCFFWGDVLKLKYVDWKTKNSSL